MSYINRLNGKTYKNYITLSQSLRDYGTTLIDYMVEYEGLIIPKCACGKNCKNHGLTFRRTCCSMECRKALRSKQITTEETKEKIRRSRSEFFKRKTGNTPWERRAKGEMSYLEIWFHEKCIEKELYCKYDIVNEYCEHPYFIDFAFINEKVAVELDGKHHFIHEDRIIHDNKRDKYLIDKGWKIFRIKYDELNDKSIDSLLLFIPDNKDKNYENRLITYNTIKNERIEKKLSEKKKNEEKKKLIIEHKIKEIKESDIIFSKYGWVNKVADILRIPPQKVNSWMLNNMTDFYNTHCFKRGNHTRNKQDHFDNMANDYFENQIHLASIVRNSNINFNKHGWVSQVSKIIPINRPSVIKWMAKYLPDILLESYCISSNKDKWIDMVLFYKNNPQLLKRRTLKNNTN